MNHLEGRKEWKPEKGLKSSLKVKAQGECGTLTEAMRHHQKAGDRAHEREVEDLRTDWMSQMNEEE